MGWEPFHGLKFSGDQWLWLMVAAAGLFIWLFLKRKSGWTPLLWLPIAAASTVMAWRFLAVLVEPSDGGFRAMGRIFALMLGWPVFVIFAGAILTFPRRWNLVPTIGGALITAIAATVPFFATTDLLIVQAIGENQQPIAGAVFEGETTRGGKRVSPGGLTSDANGLFEFRFDPDRRISFALGRNDIHLTAKLSVASGPPGNPRPDSGRLFLHYAWGLPGSSELSQGFADDVRLSHFEPIPFYLKPKDRLMFAPLQERLREILDAARESGAHGGVLESACRNVESLDLISEIAAIIPAQPQLRTAAIGGLRSSAQMLADLHDILRRLPLRSERARWNGRDRESLRLLSEWAGVPADTSPAEAAARIERKLSSIAALLIDRSRLYWVLDSHSVQVLWELGPLGKPALPLMREALEAAHPRAREALLRAVSRFRPRVEDVEWMVSSDDPEWVVAGYDAARRQVRNEEVPLALDRLRRFSNHEAETRLQMQINRLLAVLQGPPESR